MAIAGLKNRSSTLAYTHPHTDFSLEYWFYKKLTFESFDKIGYFEAHKSSKFIMKNLLGPGNPGHTSQHTFWPNFFTFPHMTFESR